MKGAVHMKKRNFIAGGLYILIGAVFLLLAIHIKSSIFFGLAGAGLGPGIVMMYRYFYWSRPENSARYLEKIMDEKIEQQDELKVKLRDKSGRYAYALGLMTISIAMFVFTILGELGIVGNSVLIVGFLGSYLLFQIVVGMVVFKHLLKKYQ